MALAKGIELAILLIDNAAIEFKFLGDFGENSGICFLIYFLKIFTVLILNGIFFKNSFCCSFCAFSISKLCYSFVYICNCKPLFGSFLINFKTNFKKITRIERFFETFWEICKKKAHKIKIPNKKYRKKAPNEILKKFAKKAQMQKKCFLKKIWNW